jgi:site-specific recombinase XerC
MNKLIFRDQTIELCLLSSSQDTVDLFNLKLSFYHTQKDRVRFYWIGAREKTLEPFRTFFYSEATKFLKEYVEKKLQEASPNEPLFITNTGKQMKPSHLSFNFKYIADKMGVLVNEDAQNPCRPSKMKTIFSTVCYYIGIEYVVRQIYMGHVGSVSEKYRKMPFLNLEKLYMKVEPYSTNFSEKNSQEIQLAQEEINEANKKVE